MNLQNFMLAKMDRGDYPLSSCAKIKSIVPVVADMREMVQWEKLEFYWKVLIFN